MKERVLLTDKRPPQLIQFILIEHHLFAIFDDISESVFTVMLKIIGIRRYAENNRHNIIGYYNTLVLRPSFSHHLYHKWLDL